MSTVAEAPRRPAVNVRLGRRSALAQWGPVLLLSALALALRASQIEQSLLGDEVFTHGDLVGRSFTAVLSNVHTGGENSPPLFFVLSWAAAHLGDASVWIRLPSVLLGSATVPVVYLLGRDVFGRTAGLLGAGVMALGPFAVFYGIEARPYATMTFFVALSTLALVRAVRSGSRGWWLAYALAAAAAAYSHYTSIFLLTTQAAWSLWVCRARIRAAVLANGLIVLLYLPWLPHLRGKALEVIGALYPLTTGRVLKDLVRPTIGHPSAPLRAIPTIAGLAVAAVIVLAGLAAAATRWWRSRPRPGLRLESERVLLAGLIWATPVGLLIYSLVATDLWLPRGLSASLPAAAIGLGALVAALARPLAVLAAAALAVTLALGTARSFGDEYNRGPYRTIAEYLDGAAKPGDPISLGTYAGSGPLLAQMSHPHRYVKGRPLFDSIGPGATGYLVLDDQLARAFHVSIAPPRGFVLVLHRHFGGGLPTELLAYRRAP